jgi:two-component system, NtrC family, response regulator AtoC
MPRTVLVIDDEQNMRWVLRRALEKAGYEVLTAENGAEGLRQFALHLVDLVLLDLKMPGMDGLAVLRELRRRGAEVPILLLTAYATVPTAVEALKLGASDYLRKPFDLETVLSQISRSLGQQTQVDTGAERELTRAGFREFVGTAPVLNKPLAMAEAAARSSYPVVVYGPPGSGRRHLAQLIHHNTSTGTPGYLVALDCASLPSPILAKELLGEVGEGSGERWQQALGGSLLLANADTVEGSLRLDLVAHLGRYLVGPRRPHGLRLLITAERTLADDWSPIVEEAIAIELPSLCERLDDIPLLRKYFAPDARWTPEASAYLAAYSWPGNVSELKRVVEQAALLAGDAPVQAEHLPSQLTAAQIDAPGVFVLPPEGIDLDKLEEDLIRQALAMAQGNKSRAARLLGLSRATLLYRLDKYAIDTSL